MPRPLALIVNPAAGGGKPARYLPQVTKVLDAAGAGYTVSRSTSLRDAQELASQAARRGETVVAFGGDGLTGALVHAVAADTLARDAALGIIPAGRGNDFARAMGIPFDPAAAARLLTHGQVRPVDLIAVTWPGTGDTQVMAAGTVYVGIASVANEIASRARLLRGGAVYNVAALRALLGWQPATFTLGGTDATAASVPSEFRGYAVVVANIRYFGTGMMVAPDARADDGLLDVVTMRHARKLAFVRVLLRIKKGSHVTMPQVDTARVKAVTVTTDRPLPFGADGEVLPARSPVSIRAVPAALRVIVPVGDAAG